MPTKDRRVEAKLLMIALIALSQGAVAAEVPSGGSEIHQIPPAPALQKEAPEIRIQPGPPDTGATAGEVKVAVTSLHITGQTKYTEAELVAVTGFRPGVELTLADLRRMAAKIDDLYHKTGYVVAHAYLPAQSITGGAVTITVIEGRYGAITLQNSSRLSNSQANGMLSNLKSGDIIDIGPLESDLLELSDTPGVRVKSSLVPGASVGASDLIVGVTPGQTLTGEVDADNEGDRYTGQYRAGGTVNLNNLAGLGDVLSLRFTTSGRGMEYGRASYQASLGKLTLGVAYTALQYRLGEEYKPLQAMGTAQIASVYGSYPLIRSRNTNVYASLDFDAKTFRDVVDQPWSVSDRDIWVGIASLIANHNDGFAGGGVTSGSLSMTVGSVDILTASARATDDAGAQTNGTYGKLSFTSARLQNITELVSLYGQVSGQVANKNLDISERLGLGGASAVQAYPLGESYGDDGFVASLEARLLLPTVWTRLPGQMHVLGFVDTGTVILDEHPWVVDQQNQRTLSSVGAGFTWEDQNDFALRAYYAHKLGDAPALSAPDADDRVWVQVVKYF